YVWFGLEHPRTLNPVQRGSYGPRDVTRGLERLTISTDDGKKRRYIVSCANSNLLKPIQIVYIALSSMWLNCFRSYSVHESNYHVYQNGQSIVIDH
ncbi:hypothetical protein BLOT_009124, partial [Blomia tropicalis]